MPNGSPYARDKNDVRLSIAVARVTESGLPLVYLNQVGGQDELVFDGASFALNADLSRRGATAGVRGKHHHAALDARPPTAGAAPGRSRRCSKATRATMRPACWACATTSARTAFPASLLGVSGGIDSALCAAIAVDALGADQVRGVMLPFRFTAQVSLDDAAKLAKALGFRYEVLPIADAVNGFEEILSKPFRRAAARHHRREFAGAHPRHAVDGDFQQDRRRWW